MEGILKAIEKAIFAEVEQYEPYIAGVIGGGWLAFAVGDTVAMNLKRPVIAASAAYLAYTYYGPLAGYGAGGLVYGLGAYRDMKSY